MNDIGYQPHENDLHSFTKSDTEPHNKTNQHPNDESNLWNLDRFWYATKESNIGSQYNIEKGSKSDDIVNGDIIVQPQDSE
jgi:hypothetical protein